MRGKEKKTKLSSIADVSAEDHRCDLCVDKGRRERKRKGKSDGGREGETGGREGGRQG